MYSSSFFYYLTYSIKTKKMNKLRIFSFLLILVFLVGCKTQSLSSDQKPKDNSITGKWFWKSRSGGLTGNTPTATKENHGTYLLITERKITKFVQGKKASESDYILTYGQSIHSTKPLPILEVGVNRYSYSMENNLLILTEEIHDGFTDIYEKNGKKENYDER
ncbi:Uncharacterised protein [Weeksella virosa]|uniref:Lipocalin-like domain-containing protein n=2 Tax=Weeksella virosa TaxID=1014 RepID=F0P158_WEEVC|nr:hypothetical protein Weevi_0844 [Weeksella virosa DSM 16922]VEH64821.1 Uncharacterised protein [Weeksella virosa]